MKRNNIDNCRTLRRNQTDAEKKLWAVLRNRQLAGIKFRRQFPIGRYILDFYALNINWGLKLMVDNTMMIKINSRTNSEQKS